MISLQDEHSAPFGAHLARLVDAVEAWADETGRIDDPDVEARLGAGPPSWRSPSCWSSG